MLIEQGKFAEQAWANLLSQNLLNYLSWTIFPESFFLDILLFLSFYGCFQTVFVFLHSLSQLLQMLAHFFYIL